MQWSRWGSLTAAGLALAGCLSPEPLLPCSSDDGCPSGEACREGECVAAPPDSTAPDAITRDVEFPQDAPTGDAALVLDVAPVTDVAPTLQDARPDAVADAAPTRPDTSVVLDATSPTDVPTQDVDAMVGPTDAAPVLDAPLPEVDAGCAVQDETCGAAELDCDAGLGETPAPGAPCELVRGLCRVPGDWACDPDRGAVCVPSVFLIEIACNGLDDDCDEAVDESDLDVIGLPCVPRAAVGPCREGILECRDGAATCVGPLPRAEACNGVDDDCDDETDEQLEGPAGEQGVCAVRQLGCMGGRPAVEPSLNTLPNYLAMDTLCDGLDNDCDGRVDEQVPVGPVCFLGLGVCRVPGTMSCVGGAMACLGPLGEPPFPRDVTCDGLDEDCDGKSDEDYASVTCGEGRCAATSFPSECVEGQVTPCRPGEPVDEVCNGVDDDCNGAVDDVAPTPGPSVRVTNGPGAVGPPGVAFDGERFVLAFYDDGDPRQFSAAAVGLDDRVLTPRTNIGAAAANNPYNTGSPKLLASPASTIVIWQDRLGVDTSRHHVSTARLDRDGVATAELPSTITGQFVAPPDRFALFEPSIAALPDGNYLVVFTRAQRDGSREVEAQVLSSGLDARVGNPLIVGRSAGESTVAMASFGDGFFIGWAGEGGVQAARIRYAGGLLVQVEAARAITAEPADRSVSLTTTATGAAMVWAHFDGTPNPGVHVVHFEADLNGLRGPFRLSTVTAFHPSIAWTGQSLGVVWAQFQDDVVVTRDLWFQRIDTQGNAVTRPGRVVEGVRGGSGANDASLIWTGSELAFAYWDFTDGQADVFLARGWFGTCPD